MSRNLLLAALILLLAGCGSMNPIDWLAPDEEANPPTELEEMANQISIRTLWRSSVGSGSDELRVKLVPAIDAGRVYVADAGGLVVALDATNGKPVWRSATELEISGGPGVGDGLVLLGTGNAELVALDVATGAERWRTRVSSEVLSVPVAADGVVIVHTVDGKLFALDSSNGKQLWVYDRSVPVLTLYGNSSPVIDNGLVVAGFATGKLVALDLHSGEIQWEVSVSVPKGRSELERMVDIDGDPLIHEGVVYVTSYQGEMAAVAEDSGVVLWRRKLSSHVGAAADWRNLYVTDTSGQVWAFDPQNGSALWKNKKLRYRRLSAPAVLGDYVIVGDFEGYLHWLSRDDGRLQARIRIGSRPISSPPVVVDEVAYVYGDGGDIAALTLAGGEKP